MNYLRFSSVDDFNTLNDTLNTAFGYPTEGTDTYALPMYNYSDPTECAMLIQDRCQEYMTEEQITNMVTSSYMQEQGWWPPTPH